MKDPCHTACLTCVCVCVNRAMCAYMCSCPQRPEALGHPVSRVTVSKPPDMGAGNQNSCPLQEQCVLLSPEPSLHPQAVLTSSNAVKNKNTVRCYFLQWKDFLVSISKH